MDRMDVKTATFATAALALGLAFPGWADSDGPPEMTRLRDSFERAVEQAVKPLSDIYLAELHKLRESYTKAARLEEALIVDAEIKRIRERLGAPELPPIGAVTERSSVRATIVPSNPNAHRLGPVKPGDAVTLKYVDGQWKSHGVIASENPDDPEESEDDRLVIAEAGTETAPGALIQIVPPNTARKKEFTYVFEREHPEVVLRINKNSERKSNPGSVVYSVRLARKR